MRTNLIVNKIARDTYRANEVIKFTERTKYRVEVHSRRKRRKCLKAVRSEG